MDYLISELVPELKQTAVGLRRWAAKDFSNMRRVLVFPKLKLSYVPIPRNASGSVLHFFGSRSGLFEPDTSEKEIRLFSFPKHHLKFASTLVFAFVRNPWARLYSVYKSRFLKQEGQVPISNDVGLQVPFLVAKRFYFEMPFDRFVDEVCRIPDAFIDPALCSQSRFLKDETGALLPQFIGQVERIDADIARLCRVVELEEEKAPHLFQTRPDPSYGESIHDYKDVFTARLYAKVARRYAEDVNLFGYRPHRVGRAGTTKEGLPRRRILELWS